MYTFVLKKSLKSKYGVIYAHELMDGWMESTLLASHNMHSSGALTEVAQKKPTHWS